MFDQFVIVHFTGLVLWRNNENFDRDVIDRLISQILVENRQIEQGIEIGAQRFYHIVFREMKLFFIASHPKVASWAAAGDVMRGLARSFANNYGATARAVEVDLDLDVFKSFDQVYQADIGSLITTGCLTSSTCMAPETKNEVQISPEVVEVQNTNTNIQKQPNIPTQSVEERMKALKAQMRASGAQKAQAINSQLRNNTNINQTTQQTVQKAKGVKNAAQEEEELQYSVSYGTTASSALLSSVQPNENQQKENIKSAGFWKSFFGKNESDEANQSFWASWTGSDGLSKIKLRLKQKLLDSNVSLEVVTALLGEGDDINAENPGGIFDGSIGSGLGARKEVKKRLKGSIERILVNGNLSILQATEERRRQRKDGEAARPYVIAVVGVNGMGKTTTVGKLIYMFQQAGLKVFCCACDSYRSGAVEQLTEHCTRLGCGLFEQGYGRSGAAVARHGIARASQEGADVVLLDTAGRMHNNGALMQELASLIRESEPDTILFVAEALVGAGGTEQLRDFNGILNAQAGRSIDGIILTKFDAVGGRVGAALNLCFASGLPIAFLGVGQGYTDLVEVDVQEIVDALV